MADEKVFMHEGGLQVTSARFITPDKTYALSGITSIGRERIDPSTKPALITCLIGLVVAFVADGAAKIVGVLVLALGVWMFTRLKATHIVVVTSSSSETKAYYSKDEGLVTKAVAALNDAVIHRG